VKAMRMRARPELDEPFAERVERLKQELALALRWDRPSILLVVYSSEFVRADAEAALEAWLHEQGQGVARIQVTGPADADVPLRLREWPGRDGTVFFVSGLRWGTPTSWNALNVRREYLVEDHIRAVFWLTEGETAELPHRAPDFWVFRHRAVEFVEPPEVGRAVQMAGELAWAGFEGKISPEERRARIAFREQLLSELPETPETAAARAELRYTLGGLYYSGREYEAALRHSQAALDLAERVDDVQLRAWTLNGLGNVYRDVDCYEEAIAAFQQAIELDPEWAYPHNDLGRVYRDLGRQEEAIAAYQSAIELDPKWAYPHYNLGNVYAALGRHQEAVAAYHKALEIGVLPDKGARVYNNLGNVYRDLGQREEAIRAFQRAIELDPTHAYPHDNLGDVYRNIGRHEEAIAEYQRGIELNPTNFVPYFNWALLEAERGNKDAAFEHLERAIELEPEEARRWARETGQFDSIRDAPRFRELVGENHG